ncbi:hypothetical protein CLOM_g20975 [Closterium sp. NIES-68]|nr:hypothetical protein CLOM_g20975 [Closterium sp. NIES-68]
METSSVRSPSMSLKLVAWALLFATLVSSGGSQTSSTGTTDPCPNSNECPSKKGCFAKGDYCDGVKTARDGSDEWPWICNFDMDCGKLNALARALPRRPQRLHPAQPILQRQKPSARSPWTKTPVLREFHLPEEQHSLPGVTCASPTVRCATRWRTALRRQLAAWQWTRTPAFCRPYVCPKGFSKCSNKLQCVDDALWCNGVARL